MRIGLFSPYLPEHFGGGEKYILDVARLWAKDHDVEVGIANLDISQAASIRQKYERFLGQPLDKVTFVSCPLHTPASWLQKILWTKKYDVLFYVTDGSQFFSLAGRNILHIQIPFTAPLSAFDRLKMKNWTYRTANSEFTRQVVSESWKIPIQFVQPPMIAKDAFQETTRKEKVILSVGRFFRQLHSKRQDVLVEIFAKLLQQEPELLKGWKMVFVGAAEDPEFAKEVQTKAEGLPVEFYHDLDREGLLAWYQKARIYLHSAGFGVDQKQHPEQVEHFGISTAEAMASGAIPVVVGKGGQPMVVGPAFQEYMWQTQEECVMKTVQLLKEQTNWSTLALQAQHQASTFDQTQFEVHLAELLQ